MIRNRMKNPDLRKREKRHANHKELSQPKSFSDLFKMCHVRASIDFQYHIAICLTAFDKFMGCDNVVKRQHMTDMGACLA